MKTTKICSIVVLYFIPLLLHAQINVGIISGEQEFINKTTDSSLFLIRQDYVLRYTSKSGTKDYRLGSKDYFGRMYSLGILSENKIWVDSKILTPWADDPIYVQYEKNDTIKPVLTKTAFRRVMEKSYKEMKGKFLTDNYYDSLSNKYSMALFALDDSLKGMPIKYNSNDSLGWIVILYTGEPIANNDTCSLKYAIYKAKPKFKTGQNNGIIKPPSIEKNNLGGVYLDVSFALGRVDLKFSGILHKEKVNWYISSLPFTYSSNETISPIVNDTFKTPENQEHQKKKGLLQKIFHKKNQ